METDLRTVFESWLARDFPELIEREYKFELSDQIIAIIGPRRAGKTYFLFQIVKKLIEKGFEKHNIAYLDFEDLRLRRLKPEHYSNFLKVLHEVFREKEGKIVLLLDEVQNLEDWPSWIRSLHNSGKYHIFISGSSSKLSSREIPTQLRGRYLSELIMPFSFKEFLKFKKFNLSFLEAPEVKGKLLNLLREYMEYGGFPEVIKADKEELKLELLRTYKETIFYRDVVERFKVRDVSSLEAFLEILIESFGKYVSLSNIEKSFKNVGIKKSKKTLANYLRYFETAFFMFTIEKFSKTKERVLQPRKVYPIDTGFFKLIPRSSKDYGLLMESLVAKELFIESFEKLNTKIFYFKDYRQKEIDFIVKEGTEVKDIIEVSYVSSKDEIEDKIDFLVNSSKELNCKNITIITWDFDSIEKIEDLTVRYVPLWKWLIY